MALWLVRTGKHGEYEQRFVGDSKIYLTWTGLKHDLSKLPDKKALVELLREVYAERDWTPQAHANKASQVWAFVSEMQSGDWVLVPYKSKPAISVGEITGDYVFDGKAEDPFYHYREVKWLVKDVPRSSFDQDLLSIFGALQTVFQVVRNNAEERIRFRFGRGTKGGTVPPKDEPGTGGGKGELIDLERMARDQIANLIIQKFKGHGLEALVEAILRAQGYTTYHSPAGPDKGIDILAAPGPLGFGHPRICVQVKSGESPVDSPTLNQLIGSMQNVHAEQGLLVSWGGFKSSVDKERAAQFFRVRLWDQDQLIGELLAHYDKLDEDLRAELPLKRIWAPAVQEEGE